MRAYIDPESLTNESASSADVDVTVPNLNGFRGIQISASGFTNPNCCGGAGVDGVNYYSAVSADFDEIAIGTSYSDVVPEPGTVAFAFAATALALRRQRRRPDANHRSRRRPQDAVSPTSPAPQPAA